MLVSLKRQLFLGGARYRANPAGVELPDFLDGKKVVLYSEWEKATDKDELIPLPKDAELQGKPSSAPKMAVSFNKSPGKAKEANKTEGMSTLSEMARSSEAEQVENPKTLSEMNKGLPLIKK
jgi:hypothetical protein